VRIARESARGAQWSNNNAMAAEFRTRCKNFYLEGYHKEAQDEYDGVKEVGKPLTLAERSKRLAAA
jgi:hypothetical protein